MAAEGGNGEVWVIEMAPGEVMARSMTVVDDCGDMLVEVSEVFEATEDGAKGAGLVAGAGGEGGGGCCFKDTLETNDSFSLALMSPATSNSFTSSPPE